MIKNMAMLKTNDIPDLDILVNAAENGDSSCEGSYSDKVAFDPDEYAGVVQWYNQQTQNFQQHYDTHLEYQKQKLAAENEAGLLEALQQSLDNFESDHMSDFACLSSSLDNPYPVCSISNSSSSKIFTNNLSPTNRSLLEQPSMLKKLLLSPSNENYPKEIDSPTSDTSSDKSKISSPSQSSSSSKEDDFRPSISKKKKPFTELLKHMEAVENDSKEEINVVDPPLAKPKSNPTTRLLNTKQYMRKYGSAPSSREGTPPSKNVTAKQPKRARIILHPATTVASAKAVSTNAPQDGKNYTFSFKGKPLPKSVNLKQQLIKSNASPPLSSTVNSSSLVKSGKREANGPIELLSIKKPKIESTDNNNNMKRSETNSADHDYCTIQSTNNTSSVGGGNDSPVESEVDFTQPENPTALQSKQVSQKVLKWQDYLQQVRAGTRSAPNSPTCSPKVLRGSARTPNNFMVVSLQGSLPPQQKIISTSSVDKRTHHLHKVVTKTIPVPVPEPLRKTVVKNQFGLQEFDQYISALKSNMNPPSTSAEVASNNVSEIVTGTDAFLSSDPLVVSASRMENTTNKQDSVSMQKSKGVTSQTETSGFTKPTTKAQIMKVGNNLRILQTSISSNKTINVKSAPVVGSSGQMLMIQVPTTSISSKPAPVPVVCKVVNRNKDSNVINEGVVPIPQTSTSVKLVPQPVPPPAKNLIPVMSPFPTDPRDKRNPVTPIKDLKLPAMMANCKPQQESTITTSIKQPTSPTFKLVTSNKDGVETKSLILSGVTGQLKDILTLMAKQQVKKKDGCTSPKDIADNKEQQAEALKKLLSVIGGLKQPGNNIQSSAAETGNAPITPPTSCQQPTGSVVTSEKPSFPSPLTLIHEIKQNFNKRKQAEMQEKKLCNISDNKAHSSATSSLQHTSTPNKISSAPIHIKSLLQSNTETISVPPPSVPTVPRKLSSEGEAKSSSSIENVVSSTITNTKNVVTSELSSSNVPKIVTSEQTVPVSLQPDISETAINTIPLVTSTISSLGIPNIVQSNANVPIVSTISNTTELHQSANTIGAVELNKKDFGSVNKQVTKNKSNQDDRLDNTVRKFDQDLISTETEEISCSKDNECKIDKSPDQLDIQIDKLQVPVSISHTEEMQIDGIMQPSASVVSTLSLEDSSSNVVKKVKCENTTKTKAKFSMTRSMAAAEMLASDVIDDGTEEILLYNKAKETADNLPNDENNNIAMEASVIDDPDPAVITLEDAMACLEEDQLLGGPDETAATNLSTADKLFCKLPSYFMTGKLMSEKRQEDDAVGLNNLGSKSTLCDSISNIPGKSESDVELEFNKLPHYFSSGKTRPNSVTRNGGRTKTLKKSRSNDDFAVKLTAVGESQHLTPQGTPVNESETYYSRLPTYYSYGRPHPAVKTFNDEVADAKDDTVTSEILTNDKNDKEKHRHSKKKRKTKKKKKHKKHKSSKHSDVVSEKVLYSKIPSYYLSGRVVASQVTEVSRRRSPLRRSPSVHYSSSPDSLYYSSRSSLSRSRSRSRSRRRSHSRGRSRRSMTYERSFSRSSRSPSYSSSCSDSEFRRSWIRERRERRNRRERSRERRRSYDSSDEDSDDYSRRREREAWKERRLYQEAKEKRQQRAMEERRVVYVGGIADKMTKQELRRMFIRFGNIETIGLHFRENGDNYGFVTFQHKNDACRAIEEGNNDVGPGQPRYTLCFGGRRQFCKTAYEDLDSKVEESEQKDGDLDDFDALLRAARRGLRR